MLLSKTRNSAIRPVSTRPARSMGLEVRGERRRIQVHEAFLSISQNSAGGNGFALAHRLAKAEPFPEVTHLAYVVRLMETKQAYRSPDSSIERGPLFRNWLGEDLGCRARQYSHEFFRDLVPGFLDLGDTRILFGRHPLCSSGEEARPRSRPLHAKIFRYECAMNNNVAGDK